MRYNYQGPRYFFLLSFFFLLRTFCRLEKCEFSKTHAMDGLRTEDCGVMARGSGSLRFNAMWLHIMCSCFVIVVLLSAEFYGPRLNALKMKSKSRGRSRNQRHKTWKLVTLSRRYGFWGLGFGSWGGVVRFIWFAVNIKAICGIISYCNQRVVFIHQSNVSISCSWCCFGTTFFIMTLLLRAKDKYVALLD